MADMSQIISMAKYRQGVFQLECLKLYDYILFSPRMTTNQDASLQYSFIFFLE